MYQPAIDERNIRQLYQLKLRLRKPMTRLVNAILDAFFQQLESLEWGGGKDAITNYAGGQVRVGSIQLSLRNKNNNASRRRARAREEGPHESLHKTQSKGIPY